jgi:hypothetical protein
MVQLRRKILRVGEFSGLITEIMATRSEHVVYVLVDSNVSYLHFVNFMDQVGGSAEGIHIAVLLGEVRRTIDRDRSQFCALQWPGTKFDHGTLKLDR